MFDRKKVVCILGATATGKSGLALELAKVLDGEIVSADSMQIYQGFTIGTAKIRPDQMQGIPHHMLDILAPDATFSVAQYCTQASSVIGDLLSRCKVPLLVGGTGLYIDSLLSSLNFEDMAVDEEYRRRLTVCAQQQGNQAVWDMLNEVDPKLAQTLHPNNLRRVIRALEVYHISGKPMSECAEKAQMESRFPAVYIGLRYADRDKLYQRIDQRVDAMMEEGLLQEIEDLLASGLSRDCQALQAIGYKEFLPVLDGEMSVDVAVEAVKRNSRRYAKRQYTWFKRNHKIHWINVDEEDVLARAKEILGI